MVKNEDYSLALISNTFFPQIALYVDLHGHSRNQNIFMYGCHTPQCDHTHFLQERVVPWLLSQIVSIHAYSTFALLNFIFLVKREIFVQVL